MARVDVCCGSKRLVVGGGAKVGSPSDDYYMGGFPKSKKVWQAAGRSYYPNHTLTAYAICIRK